MIDLVDLQKAVKLDMRPLARFVDQALLAVDEAGGRRPSIALIDDERMRVLNSTFRGKNVTTDVLSFPNEPDDFQLADADGSPVSLGDIAISAQQAQRQAAENGLDLETEIKQLILHGLLHLCGYDHETDDGQMNKRELELRDRLGI